MARRPIALVGQQWNPRKRDKESYKKKNEVEAKQMEIVEDGNEKQT